MSFPIIAIKPHYRVCFILRSMTRPKGRIDKQQIVGPIIDKSKDSPPPSHCLRHYFVPIPAILVREFTPRLLGNAREVRRSHPPAVPQSEKPTSEPQSHV